MRRDEFPIIDKVLEQEYKRGQADLLKPYDVESIEELVDNVRAKAMDEIYEAFLGLDRWFVNRAGSITIEIPFKKAIEIMGGLEWNSEFKNDKTIQVPKYEPKKEEQSE